MSRGGWAKGPPKPKPASAKATAATTFLPPGENPGLQHLTALFSDIPIEILAHTLDKYLGNVEMAAEELAFGSALRHSGEVEHVVQNRKKPAVTSRVHNMNTQPRGGGHGPTIRGRGGRNSPGHAQGWSKTLGGANSNAKTGPSSAYTHSKRHNAREHEESRQDFDTADLSIPPPEPIAEEANDQTYFTDESASRVELIASQEILPDGQIATTSTANGAAALPATPQAQQFLDTYRQYRADAIKAHRKRMKLKEQAHKLYLVGEDDAARQKHKEAAELSQRLQALNERAAKHIFNHNNPAEKSKFWIDLHGLHAREAVEFLEERLTRLARETANSIEVHLLDVVVGRGNHQEGSVILQPAVEDFLNDRKYKFKWQAKSGTFQVTIKRAVRPAD